MYMVRFGLSRTRCTRGTVIFDHNLSLSLAYQLTMADRGGCRQKRARWEAQPGSGAAEGSQLAYYLIRQTMWGAMSTKMSKTVAEYARRDVEYANSQQHGFRFRDLDAIATVSDSHSYEVLRKKLSPPKMHIDNVRLPLRTTDGRKFWGDQSVVWPHQCIHDLYHNYPDEFKRRVVPDFDEIRKFWDSMVGSPFLEGHPMVAQRGWEDTVVPLSIHGDGVSVTGVGRSWSKNVDVLSWASLLASGATLALFNLIFLMFDIIFCEIDGEHSFQVFLRKLKWSLKACLAGEFPHADDDGIPYAPGSRGFRLRGKPLCGRGRKKLRFVIFTMRADLDFYLKRWYLQNYNTYREPCEPCNNCNANTTTRSWKNVSRDAACFSTTWTQAEWEVAHPNHPNPLMDGEVMSIHVINSDWMHCAHLGVWQEYLGSILHLLFYDMLPGTPDENCRCIHSELKAYWAVNPNPGHYQNLRLNMIRSATGYPCLKGRAAEIKKMAPALLELWGMHRTTDHTSPDFVLHSQINLLLKKFCLADEILDAHPPREYPKLPLAAQQRFEAACWDMLKVMNWISHFFTYTRPRRLFKLTIKAHAIGHIALYSRFFNPRVAICYAGEDYMHHIKSLVQSSIRGNNPRRGSNKALVKLTYAMHVEWSKDSWLARE